LGAIFNTIFKISPDDKRNLYVFTYGIQKWDNVYRWIEEKFVQVSIALGTEGLIVMGEENPLDTEIKEAYGKINEAINSIHGIGNRGFIVTNINPHMIHSLESKLQPEILFIPIKGVERNELTILLDNIINAAKRDNILLLEPLSLKLESGKDKTLWNLFTSNILFQPNFSGIGFDISNFWKQLRT